MVIREGLIGKVILEQSSEGMSQANTGQWVSKDEGERLRRFSDTGVPDVSKE